MCIRLSRTLSLPTYSATYATLYASVIPDNAWILRMTAWLLLARSSLRSLFIGYRHNRHQMTKQVYDPKAFILHAALVPSGLRPLWKIPYCCLYRRSLGRSQSPVSLVILSDQLMIVVLVSFASPTS